jgi:hypothetical protein
VAKLQLVLGLIKSSIIVLTIGEFLRMKENFFYLSKREALIPACYPFQVLKIFQPSNGKLEIY